MMAWAPALFVPIVAWSQGGSADGTAATPIRYVTEISGVPEKDVAGLLAETSQLVALQEKPTATLAGLRRRADEDVARLIEALRSKGFYDGSVTPRIDASASPVKVDVKVDIGVLYLLADYRIDYRNGGDRRGLVEDMEDLGLHAGMPAAAAAVVAAQDKLIQRLAEHGRPLAKVLDRKVTVNHADRTMQVEVSVDAGPLIHFDKAEFRGAKTIDAGYLQKLVPWTAGEVFDQRQVDRLRRRLWGTDLFRTVTVAPPGQPRVDGEMPVVVEVVERPSRTISVGANYSTDRGPGGDISWEDRNLFGQQENLSLKAASDLVEQSLTADFRKPHYRRFDQTALLNATAKHQDTDAYRESTVKVFAGMERKFDEVWKGRLGPSLDYSILDDNTGHQTFLIAGLPASVARDTTDNALNPTEGSRLAVVLTPSQGMLERGISFLTQELSGSAYVSVMPEDRAVLAGRFRVASLVGADTADVPASKRIYAGGGGSVRGYGFQSLGPLDSSNDPLGGRSAIEIGFETRLRLTEDFGLVPFVEGGNVFDSAVPQVTDTLQWAAGIGGRYYTRIGPLRLDLAFPINGRSGVDSVFEFYVSLGQAF